MIRPSFLKKGDKVAIVSTARKVSLEELQPALQLLKSWQLEAIIGKTIGAEEHQFSGNDFLRAEDFQCMLNNPEIKAIWCARGGYGTVRIIDLLDFNEFKKHPKWIIGYSDVTVLHSHLHVLGFESLHAQMPVDINNKSEATIETLRQALFGEEYVIGCVAKDAQTKVGIARGQLVGGNLSILYSLCGSPSAIDTKGKILFIEDLDEYLYHIDRMLQNLKRNGYFENLAGFIVGGMAKMNDNTIPFGKTAEEIIAETVSGYNFPVCFGFPAGHMEDNQAIILGREVVLEVGEWKTSLAFKN
ncbi:MAG: LD-carboxypeptidase [Flavobacteriaceae bacterium CG2_30_34_30]|nr:LD-carboxypeptidase [Flavobacteriia bacterium]OIP50516.1 MAG: LD-carboxypeptidase [Flavobacteriaceae bacterium CG2_30_34_30]PIQ19183.1 MAG: LD-carboxypeptidase [Flavobacteriaceae bacterium CG18_big_fil_WC_8_21_14_2_50_34_36]